MVNDFQNAVTTKIGRTPTTVFSVPSDASYTAVTLSILITNRTGGNLPVDVQLVNPDREEQPFICRQKRVAGNDSVDVIKAARVVVKPTESIVVSTALDEAIDCVISYAVEADL